MNADERRDATILALKVALEQAAAQIAELAGDDDPDVVRWRAMAKESWEALPPELGPTGAA